MEKTMDYEPKVHIIPYNYGVGLRWIVNLLDLFAVKLHKKPILKIE